MLESAAESLKKREVLKRITILFLIKMNKQTVTGIFQTCLREGKRVYRFQGWIPVCLMRGFVQPR